MLCVCVFIIIYKVAVEYNLWLRSHISPYVYMTISMRLHTFFTSYSILITFYYGYRSCRRSSSLICALSNLILRVGVVGVEARVLLVLMSWEFIL